MSFSCSVHGWSHLFSPCPACQSNFVFTSEQKHYGIDPGIKYVMTNDGRLLPDSAGQTLDSVDEYIKSLQALIEELSRYAGLCENCNDYIEKPSSESVQTHADRLDEIVKYCEPHQDMMWAKYITGIALGKKDWRDE